MWPGELRLLLRAPQPPLPGTRRSWRDERPHSCFLALSAPPWAGRRPRAPPVSSRTALPLLVIFLVVRRPVLQAPLSVGASVESRACMHQPQKYFCLWGELCLWDKTDETLNRRNLRGTGPHSTRVAQSVGHVTLHLRVVSCSPTLGLEPT